MSNEMKIEEVEVSPAAVEVSTPSVPVAAGVSGTRVKYYAIRAGRETCVVEDIDQFFAITARVHGAEFAVLDTIEEADAYLTDYCGLYSCVPPLRPNVTVVGTITTIKRGKVRIAKKSRELVTYTSSAACFNNPFTWAEHGLDPIDIQLLAVNKLLDTAVDEAPHTIVLSSLVVEDGRYAHNAVLADAIKVLLDCGVGKDERSTVEKADKVLALKESDDIGNSFDDIFDLAVRLQSRKHPIAIESDAPERHLYFVRVALCCARRMLATRQGTK